MTAVKKNQPTMVDDRQHILFADCLGHETLDKQDGRIERRRYWIQDLSDLDCNGYAALYGRQQAIRIERERQAVKTGETSREGSCALTSLTVEQAKPAQLAALIRNHW